MTSLKVLISAYACRPGKGSEPGVGWNLARDLAQHHCVWAITRVNNRPGIEAYLEQHPIDNLKFIYCALPGWLERLNRAQRWVHLHYYIWQLAAYFSARRLHRSDPFDLVHHITYVRYASPSFLSLLPVPFLWGPVGGGETTPPAFVQTFSFRGRVYEWARDLARRIGELDPFVRMTARRSVIAWATTEETAQCLRRLGASRVEVRSQLGLSQDELDDLTSRQSLDADRQTQPVRFLSVGRLLHWKGFHLGLRAFAQANLPPDVEYWIVGEGPERDRLKTLASELNIEHQVKFLGALSRLETLALFKADSVLIHPSLHESGGLVCLEAMAACCPVVCLDLGGPAIQVTPATGVKVAARSPAQSIDDLAKAMAQLASQPERKRALGQAAADRACEHFCWAAKAVAIAEQYAAIVSINAGSSQVLASPDLKAMPTTKQKNRSASRDRLSKNA